MRRIVARSTPSSTMIRHVASTIRVRCSSMSITLGTAAPQGRSPRISHARRDLKTTPPATSGEAHSYVLGAKVLVDSLTTAFLAIAAVLKAAERTCGPSVRLPTVYGNIPDVERR